MFNKKTLLTLLLTMVLFSFLGVWLFFKSNSQNSDYSSGINNSNSTADSGVLSLDPKLVSGIRSKQSVFESAGPEFPDSEKILYNRNPSGEFTPKLHPADAQLWEVVLSLAPTKNIADSILTFEVYFDENDDTLASVESLSDTNSYWLYSINYVAVQNFEELIPTIVHEFAHILALQDSQTTTEYEDPDIRNTCINYLVDEGCTNRDSYLNNYYNLFWENSPDLLDQDRNDPQAEELYSTKPGYYVSSYATTNPVEDFAESFMFYTLSKPFEQNTVKAKKVGYFDNIDDLTDYRQKVIGTILSWDSN